MAGWSRGSSEHERVEALLSPYLDGRVNQSERALVERHVQSCPECSRSLATLRATVAAVRAMPRVRAPRSFALPRSMARPKKTTPGLFPVLRTATAVATFLFVIAVAGDIFLQSMLVPAAAPVPVVREFAVTSAPAFGLRQAAPTVQATQLVAAAEAYDAATPPAAVTRAPAPPAEPPVEQPLSGGEAGPGLGGGGVQPPSPGVALPPAPLPTLPVVTQADTMASAPVTPTTETARQAVAMSSPTALASVQPTAPKALAVPTLVPSPQPKIAPPASAQPTAAAQVAPAPALQPPAADRQVALQTAPPAIILLRLAQGVLAVLALVLGLMAWIVYRRSR